MAAIAGLAMGRFLSPQFSDTNPAIHATILRQLVTMDLQGYAGCGAAIRDMQLADRISEIASPTLVVTGKQDTSTPFEGHGDYLLSQIPNVTHAHIDGAHLAPLDGTVPLAAALTSFFES
jgi:pimeloyl-ACP methyl ester carboxylesterase